MPIDPSSVRVYMKHHILCNPDDKPTNEQTDTAENTASSTGGDNKQASSVFV